MKKNNLSLKQSLYFIFNILVILLLIIYLKNNIEILKLLKNINILTFFVLVIIEIIFSLVNGYINLKIINSIEKKVTFYDSLLLQFINNFFNKIIPKFGAGYRAYFLKRKYLFSYSKFVSTIAGLYIIGFLTYSLFGLVSSFLIYYKYNVLNIYIILGFFVILLSNLFLIFINPKINNVKNRIISILSTVLVSWNSIKSNKKFILWLVFLNSLMIVLAALQLKFIYKILGYDINLSRVMYLSSIGLFTTIANITPDGLGINELIYGLNTKVIEIDANILILGSLVLRGIRFIVSSIFGSISYLILNKEIKEITTKKSES